MAETDVEESELVVPFVPTATWGYLRLRRTSYEDGALATWVERIRGTGWQEAFVFFKHEDEGTGPKLAAEFTALMPEAR